MSNQYKSLSLSLEPDALALLHTHPNSTGEKPAPQDMDVADKLKIPIYTLTNRGMYQYDPVTRKTRLVRSGLSWMDKPKPK